MQRRFRLLTALGSLAAAALVSGCAHGGAMASLPSLATPQWVAAPERKPPNCKGQQNAKQYAELTETLSTSGGSLCIPEFGGFGGKVEYPAVDPSVQLTIISSTTNYNNQPQLGEGTAMFYLQLALSGGTAFAQNSPAGGGLVSKHIKPGDSYTAYGEVVISGFKVKIGPCYAVAAKSKYGGELGGLGSLLEGRDVPEAATGVIEIYAGQQTSTEC
jgi:hypothetical protein